MNKHRVIAKTLRYLFPLAYRYKKSYSYLLFCDLLLGIIQPIANVVCPKFLIDELMTDRNVENLILYTGFIIISNIGISAIRRIILENLEKYNDLYDNYFSMLLSEKTMNMDFYKTEDTSVLESLHRADIGIGWYSGGFTGIMSSIESTILSFVVTVEAVIIIAWKAPFLFITIAVFVILGNIFSAKENKISEKYYGQLSDINRKLDYVYSELSNVKYGKDYRLYDSKELLLNRAEKCSNDVIDTFKKQSNEMIKLRIFKNLFENLANAVAYAYLGILTLNRFITVGDFTMLLSGSLTMISNANGIASGYQELKKKCDYINNYISFMTTNESVYTSRNGNMNGDKANYQEINCIEFKNIFFKYPGSQDYIFEDFNFKINAGEKLAIVGKNGAGKTTFIKILTGLYKIEKGEILIDGRNIYDMDYDEYVKLFSVVFQDYKLLSAPILENILINEHPSYENDKIVRKFCEKMGILKKLNQLKKGIHTNLYKNFDDEGFVPSGGEEQKIAIIRALCKNGSFAVLDEPTAALDPKTEYEINTEFSEIDDRIFMIFISHRLSSCLLCDKIAVFDKGKVVEYGSHDELMCQENGLYNKMFTIQADNYA